MGKKEILLDSVRKLVALNVPEKEIIANMAEVGITEAQTKELIALARGEKPPALKEQKKPEQAKPSTPEEIYSEVFDELGSETQTTKDEIIQDLTGEAPEEEENAEEPFQEKTTEKESSENSKTLEDKKAYWEKVSAGEQETKPQKQETKSGKVKTQGSADFSSLWEKGILTTVDTKLSEMKTIRDEIDKVIDDKITKQMEKQAKKIEVLMQSQRTLMTAKIDSALDAKKKEFTDIVDQRMKEITTANTFLQENLTRLEASRKGQLQLIANISAKLQELNIAKQKLLSEVDGLIREAETKTEDLLSNTQSKIRQMDERINRALELESKITEGFVKDTEVKIDEALENKFREFDKKIERAIQELQSMKELSKIELLDSKLVELDLLKDETKKLQQQFVMTISSQLEEMKKLKKEVDDKILQLDEKVAAVKKSGKI